MSDQSSSKATPNAPAPAASVIQQIQTLLRAPVPRIYANGLATASTPSDITLILLAHGSPTGIVSMSYGTAKSLVKDLGGAIANYEKSTNQKVKDINEAAADLERAALK